MSRGKAFRSHRASGLVQHDSYNIEIHNKTGKDDHSMREEYGLKQNK